MWNNIDSTDNESIHTWIQCQNLYALINSNSTFAYEDQCGSPVLPYINVPQCDPISVSKVEIERERVDDVA